MQKGFAGIVLLIIVGVLGASVVATAMGIITIPWLKLNRRVQMERDIIQQTYDADNAIYTYEWFKDRHEAIVQSENKIKIAEDVLADFEARAGSRDKWTFEDKNEHARLSSVVAGLKSHRADLIAEYNANSKKVNKSIFKDDLPLFFDLAP